MAMMMASLLLPSSWTAILPDTSLPPFPTGHHINFVAMTLKVLVAQSYLTLCNLMDCNFCPWDSPGKNTGVDCHSTLQGNLPDPRIKPRSPILQADSLPYEPPLRTPMCQGLCIKLFHLILMRVLIIAIDNTHLFR